MLLIGMVGIASSYMKEGFEDGSCSLYSGCGDSQVSVTGTSNNGSYAIQISINNGNNYGGNNIDWKGNSQPQSISYWQRVPSSVSYASADVDFREESGDQLFIGHYYESNGLCVDSDDNCNLNGKGPDGSGNWHLVNYSSIDWQNGVLESVKIDGTQYWSNIDFNNKGDCPCDIGYIDTGHSSTGNSNTAWDWMTYGQATNNAPSFNSVSTSPDYWSLGDEVDFTVNVSDSTGNVSGVSASVWENGTQIKNGVQLTEDANGNWTGSSIFTVDESDVWYNVSINATDDSGASSFKWLNKSVVASELSWTDNSDNENGFRIYSNVSGSGFEQVGEVGSEVTSFTHGSSAVDFGGSRCFQVTAYNQYGESGAVEDCLVP